MIFDGATIGALLGFLGLVVTAFSGVYIATRTNNTEKEGSAKLALEETRDEAISARLTLRDEQIAQLRIDLNNCKIENKIRIEELEIDNDRLRIANQQIKET